MDMDSKKREQIGKRIISALAKSDNKTQKNLSEHLHIPENTVSYWCNGKRTPNVMQIIEISEYLNVSSDYLLGLSEHMTKNKDKTAVCDYIGCSEKTLEALMHIFNTDDESIEFVELDLSKVYNHNLKNIISDEIIQALAFEKENDQIGEVRNNYEQIIDAIIYKLYTDYVLTKPHSSEENIIFFEEVEKASSISELKKYKAMKATELIIDTVSKKINDTFSFCEYGVKNSTTEELIAGNAIMKEWHQLWDYYFQYFNSDDEFTVEDLERLPYWRKIKKRLADIENTQNGERDKE